VRAGRLGGYEGMPPDNTFKNRPKGGRFRIKAGGEPKGYRGRRQAALGTDYSIEKSLNWGVAFFTQKLRAKAQAIKRDDSSLMN